MKKLEDGTVAIAVAGKAAQDGTLYNSRKAGSKISTAREHGSLPVRYWNKHLNKERNSIWYQTLQKVQSTEFGGEPLWMFSSDHPTNVLEDTGLQSPTLKEMDNSGDFDISTHGVVFQARDPKLDPAKHFGSDVYYVSMGTFMWDKSTRPRMIETLGFSGACDSPIFSPNGKSVAFVKTKQGAAWYGHQHLFVVHDICNPNSTPVLALETVWPLSPHHVRWSDDSCELYVLAQEKGRCKLFRIGSPFDELGIKPQPLIVEGCVSDIYPFTNWKDQSRILVNRSSFTEVASTPLLIPSRVQRILSLSQPTALPTLVSTSLKSRRFGSKVEVTTKSTHLS